MAIVIIGAGQAAAQLATSLREMGYRRAISVVGDEPYLPYQRPPLSKKSPSTVTQIDPILCRTANYYTKHEIQVFQETTVQNIDRSHRRIEMGNGVTLEYEHLVIATGARTRELGSQVGTSGNLRYLRTFRDATLLHGSLAKGQDVVIVGGGFIGLEIAAVARANGRNVSLVEAGPRIMGRAVSKLTASHIHNAHVQSGIRIYTNTQIEAFDRDRSGNIKTVETGDTSIPTDVVIVGIGVIPNTELAEEAGLEVDNGIKVDKTLCTTRDPHISAIGDCSNFPVMNGARRARIESVQNAIAQARYVAKRIAHNGQDSPDIFEDLPWFWSQQGAHKLQIAGLATPEDEAVELPSAREGEFTVGRFENGKLTAVETVNSPGDHMAGRRALARGEGIKKESLIMRQIPIRAALKAA